MKNFEILIDWVAVTFHGINQERIIDILGLDIQEFIDFRPRQQGYTSCLYWNNISICFDGKKDNKDTVHLSISGQGCRFYESLKLNSWSDLFKIFLSFDTKVKFTRLDLAIDDKRSPSRDTFTVATLYRKSKSSEVVSRFKKGKLVEEFDLGDGRTIGETLIFGSRQSEIMVRFYDKKLERISKYSILDEKLKYEKHSLLPDRWLRTELEIKSDKATLVAYKIAMDDSVGDLAVGILKHYVRFIDIDKSISNKSRQPTWRKWSAFTKLVEPIALVILKPEKTLDEKIYHLEKQYARTLAKVEAAEGFDFIKIITNRGKKRLDDKDKQEISVYKYQKLEDRLLKQREFENLKIMHDNIKKVPSNDEIKGNNKN